MIRKITFDLYSPATDEKVNLVATFTDEELKQLDSYILYVRQLAETKLGRHGFTPRLNLHMKKDGDGWDANFESTLPDWNDTMAFLHRLRPLILSKEHASFEKICGLIGRKLNDECIRNYIKQQRFLYSGELFQSQARIKVNDIVINSDETLMKWLNAYEYHTDQDKKAEIDFLKRMIPFHSLQTLFMMHIVDKANAIRNVCKLAMTILKKDGIGEFEFQTFKARK